MQITTFLTKKPQRFDGKINQNIDIAILTQKAR